MRNVLTIEAFREFCEKQPADKEYDWWDACECAGARYAESLGLQSVWNNRHYVPAGQFWVKIEKAAALRPWTFGALVSRLREIRP